MTVPHEPMPLSLRLFGPPGVEVRGEPLPRLRSRRGLWLLALLALRGGKPVERTWLAGLLWPDSTDSQGLASLRRTLTDLRTALGPEGDRLAAPTPRTLVLDLTEADVDVIIFDADITSDDPATVERAVARYRGPLLEGCIEEWVGPERQYREERWLQALERLAADALRRGEPEAAVQWLRRVVAADPLRESAQRAHMEALAGCGNYTGAVVAYRSFRQHVLEELREEPDPETTALFQRIRAEARRLAAAAPAAVATVSPAPALQAEEPTGPETSSAPVAPRPGVGGERDLEPAPAAGSLPEAAFVVPALPRPLTALVGRAEEVEEIRTLLSRSPLVALTGPAGVGKTRLAVQVATEHAECHPDGVLFVDLTSVVGDGLVPGALAAALRVREQPGQSLTATLTQVMRPSEMLLVLDNCEHVIDGCARLVRSLLEGCPHLRILLTGRQALGITGEISRPIASLSVPETAEVASEIAEPDLARFPAVQLFVERACAVVPTFRLTSRNAETVVRLLQHLDGIPLAIELAAARMRVLSVEQIAARIDDRFRLLAGGSRGGLPRHQSLHSAVDWSYQLLSPSERTLLRRLAVFAGSFNLDDAQVVCVGDEPGTSGLSEFEILDYLDQLVQKSLVQVSLADQRETRYRLLETTRAYVRELWNPDEAETICYFHADYHLALAERTVPELGTAALGEALDRLEAAHDNLRSALQWLTRDGGAPHEAELGLRLAAALAPFWQMRGYFTEGRGWLARALGRNPEPSPARAAALSGSGTLARELGFYEAARAAAEESLAISTALGDRPGVARELDNLGSLACFQGDCSSAVTLHEQALEIHRELGDPRSTGECLRRLGWALYSGDEPSRACSILRESLSLHQHAGDPSGFARCLSNLGLATEVLEGGDAARPMFRQCLEIAQRLGLSEQAAAFTLNLGIAAATPAEAAVHYSRALVLYRRFGIRKGIALCLQGLGESVEWDQVTPEYADWAVQLFGASDSLFRSVGHVLPGFAEGYQQELFNRHRRLLGEDRFADRWTKGAAMPLEEAISLALAGHLTEAGPVSRRL